MCGYTVIWPNHSKQFLVSCIRLGISDDYMLLYPVSDMKIRQPPPRSSYSTTKLPSSRHFAGLVQVRGLIKLLDLQRRKQFDKMRKLRFKVKSYTRARSDRVGMVTLVFEIEG